MEIDGEDPQTRIVRGFQELIVRTYPNLRMLRGITYSEDDIASYLQLRPRHSVRRDAANF